MPTAQTINALIERILVDIEGPEVILARDAIGTQYICALTSIEADGEHFLATPISSNRLSDISSGHLDLRAALSQSELALHYAAVATGPNSLALERISSAIPEAWLPDEGLFLDRFIRARASEDVVKRAMSGNTAVVVCKIDSPNSGKIDADLLGECLTGFQNLVRHAVKRTGQYSTEEHVLEVCAFATGSFEIHFESKHSADLFGNVALANGMRKVDELMQLVNLPIDQALTRIQDNRGHIIGAYAKVLQLISSLRAPFEYRWAEPAMPKASVKRIVPLEAKAIYEMLETREDLGTESRRFSGRFTKVDTNRNTWSILTDDKKTYAGVAEDESDLLTGITINSKIYNLLCEEYLEQRVSHGKPNSRLVLVNVTEHE